MQGTVCGLGRDHATLYRKLRTVLEFAKKKKMMMKEQVMQR
jgi:ribosomal protein L27